MSDEPSGDRYRTPPGYDVVPRERLPEAERRRLDRVADLPELYGILRPREDAADRPVKAVDRDTALLLLTLREPGPLPRWVRGDRERIRELVLEGVLQVRDGDEFVSGPEAASLLARPPDGEGDAVLERLSRAALEHAAALPLDEIRVVARRLYDHHRLPHSPAWARRLASPGRVRSFLGLGAGPPDGWRPVDDGARPDDGSGGAARDWLSWRRSDGRGRSVRTEVKLYVSPRPGALAGGLPAVARALRQGGAAGFKVGATAGNLLRPDKLVAYFSDREALQACASRLDDALGDVPAHGVPFTAPAGSGALLSWGADPPAGVEDGGDRSWRSWLCGRLAVHLVEAREAPPERRVAYARERIRADGVDPDGWRPSSTLWGSG